MLKRLKSQKALYKDIKSDIVTKDLPRSLVLFKSYVFNLRMRDDREPVLHKTSSQNWRSIKSKAVADILFFIYALKTRTVECSGNFGQVGCALYCMSPMFEQERLNYFLQQVWGN